MPIAVQTGTELLTFHTDHLNTPRRLTDRNGQPAWQWLWRSGTQHPGQQYDKETGLYYTHHRTYDPYLTVGYLQADPLGLAAGWNRFAYVNGNPLSFVDLHGLNPFTGAINGG